MSNYTQTDVLQTIASSKLRQHYKNTSRYTHAFRTYPATNEYRSVANSTIVRERM